MGPLKTEKKTSIRQKPTVNSGLSKHQLTNWEVIFTTSKFDRGLIFKIFKGVTTPKIITFLIQSKPICPGIAPPTVRCALLYQLSKQETSDRNDLI